MCLESVDEQKTRTSVGATPFLYKFPLPSNLFMWNGINERTHYFSFYFAMRFLLPLLLLLPLLGFWLPHTYDRKKIIYVYRLIAFWNFMFTTWINSVNKSLYALGDHKLTEIFHAASYVILFLFFNMEKLFTNSELLTELHTLIRRWKICLLLAYSKVIISMFIYVPVPQPYSEFIFLFRLTDKAFPILSRTHILLFIQCHPVIHSFQFPHTQIYTLHSCQTQTPLIQPLFTDVLFYSLGNFDTKWCRVFSLSWVMSFSIQMHMVCMSSKFAVYCLRFSSRSKYSISDIHRTRQFKKFQNLFFFLSTSQYVYQNIYMYVHGMEIRNSDVIPILMLFSKFPFHFLEIHNNLRVWDLLLCNIRLQEALLPTLVFGF